MKWGIQAFDGWADYPTWNDYDAWDDEPLRFETKEDADKWIVEYCIKEFVQAFDAYERTLPRRWLNDELQRMRMEALESAGLINHPFEPKGYFGTLSPVVHYGRMGSRPKFKADEYKSVPDNEMSNPNECYDPDDRWDWPYSRWNPNG